MLRIDGFHFEYAGNPKFFFLHFGCPLESRRTYVYKVFLRIVFALNYEMY